MSPFPSPSLRFGDLTQMPQPAAANGLPPVTFPHILHKLSAGFPSPAADYVEARLDLNDYLVRNKTACFFFTVEGESMRDAGILPGDVLAVDRSITPTHGSIVVAVIDHEYTVKRLYRRGSTIELRPENPAFPPIRIRDGQELSVWGVVVGVIRKLGS